MIGIVSPLQALEFIVLFLVLQQIEGNLIYPHVVGNSVGLPSIWVFVAVIIGGNLMGILGMFLFIPLTSILYTLFKEYIKAKGDNRSWLSPYFISSTILLTISSNVPSLSTW